LPDPVGAAMRACRPSRIAGQASNWQGVGAVNRPENQFRMAGWRSSSAPKLVRIVGLSVLHESGTVDRVASGRNPGAVFTQGGALSRLGHTLTVRGG
jgi:hypothetical protein